jgi:general secretion pathway protein G
LEILVSLTIIGLLAGLAIMNIGSIHLNAENAAARLMVQSSLKTALNVYRMSMGDFPSTAEGLPALLASPPGKMERWHGPYVEGEIPLDPWGQPYQYAYPGMHNKTGYDLWSNGHDHQAGTDDDITNWKLPVSSPPNQ